jgi:uncharacterized membrane protein (DUF4010 family)
VDKQLLYRLAVALGVGAIVGIERAWQSRLEPDSHRPAGFRTFALVGLSGGVFAITDRHPVVLAAGALVVGALIIAAYLRTAHETNDFGLTTELALLATFGLGAAAVLGAPFEAAAAAIVMALVLSMKGELHRLVNRIERAELVALLKLLLIAAVIVPLLPSQPMGPWHALNPRTIGMLVLLIAGLSYVGYVAVRALGSRLGLMLTALFGGLSSSTAITVAYARRSVSAASHSRLFGAGIALSAAMMVPRLSMEIAAVNPEVLRALWPTFVTLAVVPTAGAWLAWRSQGAEAVPEIKLSNPLQLRAALTFGLLLSLFFIAAQGLERALGDAGIYVMAAVAGLVDVDAVGLALAQSANGRVSAATAQRGIVVAVLVNTAVKAALAALLGGVPMLRSASVVLAIALFSGATVALLTLH